MRVLGFAVLLAAAVVARADVAVRVVDPSGRVIPGATVVLQDESGAEIARAESSPRGDAPFSGDGAQVEVRADGFEREVASIASPSEIVVVMRLAAVRDQVDVADSLEPVAPVAAEPAERDELAKPGLVESLRATAHVHVLRRGGTNLEPVVQGLRETQIAMVVDGTRTFAAGPACMDSELSHVDPGDVASVEVVTGPYALAEGAGAMSAILVRSAEVPASQDWRMDGRLGLAWRSNGSGRLGQARINGGDSVFGFSLRAAGDLLGDYESGGLGLGASPLVPGDAAAHQLGGKLRYSPSARHELGFAGLYDEQTGVDYPGRLLTAEHFLLRSWQASYRFADPDGMVSAVKLSAYVSKKSHRMSNRGKPTAMDAPGRVPPFALDVSLPAESDTVGGAGRVEFAPGDS